MILFSFHQGAAAMKTKIFILTVLSIFLIALFSGCTEDGDDGDDEYFKESYRMIYYSFEIGGAEDLNETEYIIIPAPIQNGRTLELAESQFYTGFENLTIETIETEYGTGIKISPIPTDKVWLWFSCDIYTTQAPFDIKQNEQFYSPEYPGLSQWETDGEASYYWFYSSTNVTSISLKYEYSDCYGFADMVMYEDVSSGWIRLNYTRVQELMPM
jgi:hypothetical protein